MTLASGERFVRASGHSAVQQSGQASAQVAQAIKLSTPTHCGDETLLALTGPDGLPQSRLQNMNL